ncbi:MAG: DUF1214 domain-containing protein [Aeromicrobium sp.]
MMADFSSWGDVEQAAERLQVWGFPLVFAQRVRLNFTQPVDPDGRRPPTSAGAAVDTFGHQRELSTPELRVGVAPNVDTLYSVAWVDLDAGPRRLVLPDFGDRYYSVQVALSDTSSPWALGRRTHGGRLPALTLRRGSLAARESGDGIELATPHRYLMLCVRILVEPDDPHDLVRVHALQDSIALTAAAGVGGQASSTRERDIALAAVDRADEIGDPSAFGRAMAAVVADSAPESVPPGVLADLETCARSRPEAVAAGLSAGLERIDGHVRGMGDVVDGWAVNWRGPDFGDDVLLRAAVAYSQIFVNPAVEAVYPVCETDADGASLDATSGDYEIVFPADDLPPVDSFWSLTMYHAAGLLVANEARRYAIGDRTPGLRRSDDGSLVVRLSSSRPPEGEANWLPAPDGPFRLMLRLYGPQDDSWRPPPVRRIDA